MNYQQTDQLTIS